MNHHINILAQPSSIPPRVAQHEGVSVVIKAYNEAHHIEAAIASVLAAAHEITPLPLDVVIADGGSTDTTLVKAVAMATHAPVRVMQLSQGTARTCGAGVELGYASCGGRWILFMDGDMTLHPGFLRKALVYLRTHPQVAGVAGAVCDRALRNGTDRIRSNNRLGQESGVRPWLEGGGLYRRKALEQAGGYAADARLAAFEEADLGLRIRRAGWQLVRLNDMAMWHDGHPLGTLALLGKRWRDGRMAAAGMLLRLHATLPYRQDLLRLFMHPIIMGLWWGFMPLAWAMNGILHWAAASLFGFMGLWAKKQDLHHTLTSVLDWHAMLAGIVHGLVRAMPQRPAVLPALCWAEGPGTSPLQNQDGVGQGGV